MRGREKQEKLAKTLWGPQGILSTQDPLELSLFRGNSQVLVLVMKMDTWGRKSPWTRQLSAAEHWAGSESRRLAFADGWGTTGFLGGGGLEGTAVSITDALNF